MFRKAEKEVAWKAGAYAIAVHGVLLGALLISFNWKSAHPVLNVAEVELWDSLPTSAPQPTPIIEQKIDTKPESKAETPPVVQEDAKPDTKADESNVDIELEKKKALEQKKADEKTAKLEAEKLKKEQELENKKRLDAIKASLDDTPPDASKPLKEKKTKDDLRKLQQDALAEDNAEGDKQAKAAKAAASKGIIDEYRRKIQDKIKGNVNNSLCGDGDPTLKFQISLMPTGELSGSPKLTKSSDIEACDEAVERAIIASQPLPMPEDAELKNQFKNLNLTFNPNRE